MIGKGAIRNGVGRTVEKASIDKERVFGLTIGLLDKDRRERLREQRYIGKGGTKGMVMSCRGVDGVG